MKILWSLEIQIAQLLPILRSGISVAPKYKILLFFFCIFVVFRKSSGASKKGFEKSMYKALK